MLWNEEAGAWLDFDIINQKPRPYFVASNLSPLWMRCYKPARREHIAKRVLDYIKEEKLDDFPGGIPTTTLHSGEQWDWPNVWAPLQHILIVGLDNLEDHKTKHLAQDWAQRWVESNYRAYKENGVMYEKVRIRYSRMSLNLNLIFVFHFSTLRLSWEDMGVVESMRYKKASVGQTA